MATNTVYGTVIEDSTGKVVPKTVVTARCSDTTQTATTDDNGYFEFDNVPQESCTFTLANEDYSITGMTIVANEGNADVLETGDL